jgi:hypothetical protein
MKRGLYKCDQSNCPGHDTFTANCLTDMRPVADYPLLTMFQNGWDLEDPTEPVMAIHDEPAQEHKSGGRATQEMKQYNNKAAFNFTTAQKHKVR